MEKGINQALRWSIRFAEYECFPSFHPIYEVSHACRAGSEACLVRQFSFVDEVEDAAGDGCSYSLVDVAEAASEDGGDLVCCVA